MAIGIALRCVALRCVARIISVIRLCTSLRVVSVIHHDLADPLCGPPRLCLATLAYSSRTARRGAAVADLRTRTGRAVSFEFRCTLEHQHGGENPPLSSARQITFLSVRS